MHQQFAYSEHTHQKCLETQNVLTVPYAKISFMTSNQFKLVMCSFYSKLYFKLIYVYTQRTQRQTIHCQSEIIIPII